MTTLEIKTKELNNLILKGETLKAIELYYCCCSSSSDAVWDVRLL